MATTTFVVSGLGKRWRMAGERLGFEVVAPFRLALPGIEELHADALVTEFGAKNGMLVFSESSEIWPARFAVDAAGYGFSVMRGPATERGLTDDDLAVFVEVLRDWGWGGPAGSEPAWLRQDSNND